MRSLFLLLLALPALACAQAQRPLKAGSTGVTVNANNGFTISEPGSYLLTNNLTVASGSGILITASQVTLDLGGYTIASTAGAPSGSAAQHGIAIGSGSSDIAISNGHIVSGTTLSGTTFQPAGFGHGIDGRNATGCSVTGVAVIGVSSSGIQLAIERLSSARGCTALRCPVNGVSAYTVTDCAASDCGNMAIYAIAAGNCSGSGVGHARGVSAKTTWNCTGTASGSGVGLYSNSAQNCVGISEDGTGLQALSAINCYGSTIRGIGLHAENATNCFGSASFMGMGLSASVATGCVAESQNNTALFVEESAENCRATARGSGIGLCSAGIAMNCIGSTVSGPYGLYVECTASFCLGNNDAGGTARAIQATNAIGCSVRNGKVIAGSKSLGTP